MVEVADLVEVAPDQALLEELDAARDLDGVGAGAARREQELERLLVAPLGQELLELLPGAGQPGRLHRLLGADARLAKVLDRPRLVRLHVEDLCPHRDRVVDETRMKQIEAFLEETLDAGRRVAVRYGHSSRASREYAQSIASTNQVRD